MRPANDVRRAALILVVLAGACYPGWLAVGPFAEPPAAEDKGKAKAKEDEKPKSAPSEVTPAILGVNACSNVGCHGGNPPTKQWKKEGFEVLCRCDEAERWEAADKHGDAYKVLEGERGRRMTKLLGYQVAKSLKCLSCHAVVIPDAKAKDGSGFHHEKEEDGVSCVACHGAAEDWVVQHGVLVKLKSWRALDRNQKERWFGMTDLWDPAKRTKLCASCHIGNAEQGKVVTHDMYAAGHPPLPGFEAATFSDEMPRHWQYRAEKPEAVQKEQGYDGKTREPTQLLLVGAAVSLGESLRLIAAQAAAQKAGSDPELAMFDCYSCHHEIRSPSWRLTKPAVEKPGRVPMKTWPLELVRLGVRHLAKDDAAAVPELAKLDAHTRALEKAFIAKQLGDAPKIVEEAKKFIDWTEGLTAKLQKAEVNAEATKKLLALLPATFAKETLDFDSARQVAWGYEVLSRDFGAGKEKPDPALEELVKYLDLRFPKGRMKAGAESPLEAALGARLKTLNDYQPAEFRTLLKKLGGGK